MAGRIPKKIHGQRPDDWIEISLIVLPVFGPLFQGLDFSAHVGPGGPIVFLSWFVILLAVNLQTSFLTPPFGFTLFCMRGIVPFVLLQVLGMTLVLAFPGLALWLPRVTGLLN